LVVVLVLILKLFCMYYRIGQMTNIVMLLGNAVLSLERGERNIGVRKNPVVLNVNWKHECELF